MFWFVFSKMKVKHRKSKRSHLKTLLFSQGRGMLAEIRCKWSASFYPKSPTPELSWLHRARSIHQGWWINIMNVTNGFSLIKVVGLLISLRVVKMSSYLRRFIGLMISGLVQIFQRLYPTIAQTEWTNPVRSVACSFRNDGGAQP